MAEEYIKKLEELSKKDFHELTEKDKEWLLRNGLWDKFLKSGVSWKEFIEMEKELAELRIKTELEEKRKEKPYEQELAEEEAKAAKRLLKLIKKEKYCPICALEGRLTKLRKDECPSGLHSRYYLRKGMWWYPMDFVYSAGVKVWVGKNPKPLTKKEAKRVYQNLLAKAEEGVKEITLEELKHAEKEEIAEILPSLPKPKEERALPKREEIPALPPPSGKKGRSKRLGSGLGKSLWKSAKKSGNLAKRLGKSLLGTLKRKERKRKEKPKFRIKFKKPEKPGIKKIEALFGIIGIFLSIIVYLATESLLLFLPPLAGSLYLLVRAGEYTIYLIEDYPILIASLILSTVGFIFLSWWGLLAGPALFALSKTIPKEETRSIIGKLALYIMLIISFIFFLPNILAYTAIEIDWIMIVGFGIFNGILLGYIWDMRELGSKEELEKKLLIEQLKQLQKPKTPALPPGKIKEEIKKVIEEEREKEREEEKEVLASLSKVVEEKIEKERVPALPSPYFPALPKPKEEPSLSKEKIESIETPETPELQEASRTEALTPQEKVEALKQPETVEVQRPYLPRREIEDPELQKIISTINRLQEKIIELKQKGQDTKNLERKLEKLERLKESKLRKLGE